MSQPTPKLHSIQFLRFVAALMVAAYHAVYFTSLNISPLPPALTNAAETGAAGVHIFFVISGFIMVWTTRHHFGKANYINVFLQRRFIRIFPIYWALAAINIVLLTSFELGGAQTLYEGFMAAFLMPAHSSKLIFVGWTLTYEIFFYAAFALFIPFARLKAIAALSLAFCALILGGFVLQPQSAFFSIATSPLLIEFIAGAWIALAIIHGRSLSMLFAQIMIVIATGVFILTAVTGPIGIPLFIVWGAPSAVLVAGALSLEINGGVSKTFEQLAHLGDSSYSLYLVHAMLLPPLTLIIGRAVDMSAVFAIALAFMLTVLCVVVGHITYLFVEKPLIIQTKRFLTAKNQL